MEEEVKIIGITNDLFRLSDTNRNLMTKLTDLTEWFNDFNYSLVNCYVHEVTIKEDELNFIDNKFHQINLQKANCLLPLYRLYLIHVVF